MKWLAALVAILLFIPLPVASHATDIDLEMAWVKARRLVAEGELVTITARVENHSNGRVPSFSVSFYLDDIDPASLLGRRQYDSVNVYRRPRITWDTTNETGNHTVIARVDIDDDTGNNNVATTPVTICTSTPRRAERQIQITELYPHPYPGEDTEYVCIHNPSRQPVNLNHWRLTTTPQRRSDEQTRVVLPNIQISPRETLYIVQDAPACRAAGIEPDYAYGHGGDTPELEEHGWFILANDGAALCLKDSYNHTIDTVVYGDAMSREGWQGPSIPAPDDGVILYRGNTSRDSNSSRDWQTRRIGTTIRENREVTFTGTVTVFASPDNGFSVVEETLDSATGSIYLNLYTFTNPWLCDAVCRAVRRNVSVTMLLEGQPVGGLSIKQRYLAARVARAGGDVRYMYHADGRRRYPYNHAKYAVVDNQTVVIASANWGVTGLPPGQSYGNREWGIAIHNETIARQARRVFMADCTGRDVASTTTIHETYGAPPERYIPPRWPPTGSYQPCCPARTIHGTFTCTLITAPDTAERAIQEMLSGAQDRILVEQAVIEPQWSQELNPFLSRLARQRDTCSDIRVLLNMHPSYTSSCRDNTATRAYLEQRNVSTRFFYTNASALRVIHTKGAIVDNATLISSINWNENAVRWNRELGVIIENDQVATYFAKLFNHDWHLTREREPSPMLSHEHVTLLAVTLVWTAAAVVLIRHWRQ